MPQFGVFSLRKQLLLFPHNPFQWQTLPKSQLKQKTHARVDQRCSGNFVGAAALLGIFAYICRQRPVIHCIQWWRLRSGALAAWHHWCGRSQNWTGINWILIECSNERNIFWWHTWTLLVKGRYLQNFSTPLNLSVEILITEFGSTCCCQRGISIYNRIKFSYYIFC